MIAFVTGNPSKAEQLEKYVATKVAHKKLDLDEIQSLSLEEIVKHKVMEAYKYVQGPVLVEDTSLTFDALGKLPGPLIKWFLQELGNDGLSNMLHGYPSRKATAEVLFGYYDGITFKTFKGEVAGTIAKTPLGEHGFGWDPLFIPDGQDKTWGEMTPAEQTETSLRKPALQKLARFLRDSEYL